MASAKPSIAGRRQPVPATLCTHEVHAIGMQGRPQARTIKLLHSLSTTMVASAIHPYHKS